MFGELAELVGAESAGAVQAMGTFGGFLAEGEPRVLTGAQVDEALKRQNRRPAATIGTTSVRKPERQCKPMPPINGDTGIGRSLEIGRIVELTTTLRAGNRFRRTGVGI